MHASCIGTTFLVVVSDCFHRVFDAASSAFDSRSIKSVEIALLVERDIKKGTQPSYFSVVCYFVVCVRRWLRLLEQVRQCFECETLLGCANIFDPASVTLVSE